MCCSTNAPATYNPQVSAPPCHRYLSSSIATKREPPPSALANTAKAPKLATPKAPPKAPPKALPQALPNAPPTETTQSTLAALVPLGAMLVIITGATASAPIAANRAEIQHHVIHPEQSEQLKLVLQYEY